MLDPKEKPITVNVNFNPKCFMNICSSKWVMFQILITQFHGNLSIVGVFHPPHHPQSICLYGITLKHGESHFGTSLVYLIGVPLHCSICMDKVKITFQCITYLLLILNCNMHWLKYIRCKISIRQVLTFRGLFASLL